MEFEFSGELFEWRGPSPFHFVAVPQEHSEAIRAAAKRISYGWGVIPAEIESNGVTWNTALIPKDGNYLIPVKDVVRKQLMLGIGQAITLTLTLDV